MTDENNQIEHDQEPRIERDWDGEGDELRELRDADAMARAEKQSGAGK